MAVDKKSDHYTSAKGYTDLDGMSRQFTFVDHDKKTTISTHTHDLESLTKEKNIHVHKMIMAIISFPAHVLLQEQGLYDQFIEIEGVNYVWNQTALVDTISINWLIGYNLFNYLWKKCVKEQYWFKDMPFEDVAKGEWRKWSINNLED